MILKSEARLAQVKREKQMILDSEERILAQAQRERQVLLNSEARILAQVECEKQMTDEENGRYYLAMVWKS